MSACGCEELPEIFYVDRAPADWLSGLEERASADWKTLGRCSTCGRLFSVDVWDRYQPRVVVRIAHPERWKEEGESVEARKALLLAGRGGTDELACGWAGCDKPRVRGVAYCLDHLWDSGARR